jgi:hypothetical protein
VVHAPKAVPQAYDGPVAGIVADDAVMAVQQTIGRIGIRIGGGCIAGSVRQTGGLPTRELRGAKRRLPRTTGQLAEEPIRKFV